METENQKTSGSPDPRLEARDGKTAGTAFVSTVYQNFLVKVAPGICRQCADHHRPGDEFSDGKPYACGLMVEAMDAGHTVGSCAHFRFGAITPILDSETLQAGTGIRGAAAAIQNTMFADREPFDPEHCVRDRVGS